MTETRAYRNYAARRLKIAEDAIAYGPTRAAELNKCGIGMAKYNKMKLLDPESHPETVGGARNVSYSGNQQALAEYSLWLEVQINAARNYTQLAKDMRAVGWTRVSRKWVSKVLRGWRWSARNIKWRSPLKYTPENIVHYINYLWDIRLLAANDVTRIKFLDEVHFSPRGACDFVVLLFSFFACVLVLTRRFEANAWCWSHGRPSADRCVAS